MSINTHNLIVEFGKHKGTLWTRLPVSYLKWLANQAGPNAGIAKAELERRGTVTPELDISGHAIDRASLNCLDIYRKTREPEEGLHAWLIRMCTEARQGQPDRKGRFRINGMLLAFQADGSWPVLVTVMRDKNGASHE